MYYNKLVFIFEGFPDQSYIAVVSQSVQDEGV